MNIDYNKLKSDYDYRHKFYVSKEWRNLREYKISLNPLCEICLTEDKIKAAVDVDHIIDIKDNPYLCLDINNLKSLCKSCHSKKTMETNNPSEIFKRGKIIKPYKSSLWD